MGKYMNKIIETFNYFLFKYSLLVETGLLNSLR